MFRGIVTAVAFFLILSPGHAATIYVPDNYATIQGALDACVNGDEIIVRPGTYYEVVDFVGKAVTLKSEMGPEVTIVDGEQRDWGIMMFRNFEGPDSVLEGFTIT
jgi:serine protease